MDLLLRRYVALSGWGLLRSGRRGVGMARSKGKGVPVRKAVSQKTAQFKKFVEAARAAGVDEDEARWEERLKAIAKHRTPKAK